MNSTRTNLPIIHKLIDYRPQIPADNYLSLSSKYDQSRIYITRLELTSNMCYFPIRCLKAVVFLGSICSILISLALLARTPPSPSHRLPTSRKQGNHLRRQLIHSLRPNHRPLHLLHRLPAARSSRSLRSHETYL
jgi:hypothetical protein